MEQMMKALTKFEEDASWFFKNRDNLVEQYENKFVAIENAKVIDSDKDMNRLIERLKEKRKNPSNLLIKFVKKIKIIL